MKKELVLPIFVLSILPVISNAQKAADRDAVTASNSNVVAAARVPVAGSTLTNKEQSEAEAKKKKASHVHPITPRARPWIGTPAGNPQLYNRTQPVPVGSSGALQ